MGMIRDIVFIVASFLFMGLIVAVAAYVLSLKCVEKAPFDIGNETLGASGSYCVEWESRLINTPVKEG